MIATTKSNVNATLLVTFLHNLITLCKSFFNGHFDENSIRKNFAVIYELLDEVMDYGYPQIVDADLLKEYIATGKANKNAIEDINKLK